MKLRPDEHFQQLLELAKTDPNVLAFWLDGSRGKGRSTEHSDYDCILIVSDAAFPAYNARYARNGQMDVDVAVMTLDGLRAFADWHTPDRVYRYKFARLRPLVDKVGGLQALLDEKGRIPEPDVRPFIEVSLDHFINQAYRTIKCHRDGNLVGARVEAAEAVNPLLDAWFALDHGRLRPYAKYLEWELTAYPLPHLTWDAAEFIRMLLQMLKTADIGAVQALVRGTVETFAEAGYEPIFTAWGKGLPWLLGYRVRPLD